MSKDTSKTVTVACKMPNGLLLRLFNMEPYFENVLGGGKRETTKARQIGQTVKINGTATPFGSAPACLIVGGFAMTPGIDREFFDRWLEQNADSDVVKNGLIFAHGKATFATGKAKEMTLVRNGLEPINPERTIRDGKSVAVDPRIPRNKFGHVIEAGQVA